MKALLQLIRVLVGFVFFIAVMIVLFAFSVLTLRRFSERISGPVLRFWGRTTLAIIGVKLIVKNASPFDEPAPRVTIVNHLSTLDVVWASAVCPDAFSCIGKRELRWVFPFNIGWWSFRLYYIDRRDRASAIRTLKEAARDMVARKRTVMMAPEGTRSPDGRMQPFKKGAFHLAMSEGLPLFPIVVAGASEAMPKKSLLPRAQPIHLTFLEPIETSSWREEELDERIAEVREVMDQAYHALRAEAGLPPLN